MTAPDPRGRGLDRAHILGVVAQATSSGHLRAARPGGEPGCYRLRLPSRRDARDASAALTRVGYQITRPDSAGHRELLVTGWIPAGLESRLAAMRSVLYELASEPTTTAAAVIAGIRRLPAGSTADPVSVLAGVLVRLRTQIGARSGIHAPHNPATQPADLGSALRLRAAWTLEAMIDDLIERHLRLARHALSLFCCLRLHASDDQAAETAIRRAGITFHYSGSAAQDSSPLLHGTVGPAGLRVPPPDPADGLRAVPVGREFPGLVTSGGTSPGRPLALVARHLPAGRPRLRR